MDPLIFCTYALTLEESNALPYLIRRVAPYVDAISVTIHTELRSSSITRSLTKKTYKESFFLLPGGSRTQRKTLVFECQGKPLVITYINNSLSPQDLEESRIIALKHAVHTAILKNPKVRVLPFSITRMTVVDPSKINVNALIDFVDARGDVVTKILDETGVDHFLKFGDFHATGQPTSSAIAWKKRHNKPIIVKDNLEARTLPTKLQTISLDTWAIFAVSLSLLVMAVIAGSFLYSDATGNRTPKQRAIQTLASEGVRPPLS